MVSYDEYYSAIDEIKEYLSRDLIGPIEEDEVIESIEPLSYYAMGILWAKRLGELSVFETSQVGVSEEEVEDAVNSDNDSISDANKYKPSAMGMSVMLPVDAKELKVTFTYGKYKVSSIEKKPDDESKKEIKVNTYTRKQYEISTVFKIPGSYGTIKCKENEQFRNMGVDITLCVRKIMHDGSKLITVSVSNAVEAPQMSKEQNESAMFQCHIQLFCAEGFTPIYQNMMTGYTEEEQIETLQYRNIKNYAYGHGCSVEYTESTKITEIASSFIPAERVFQMRPGTIKDKEILKLTYWNKANRTDACRRLELFISEYKKWREEQFIISESLVEYHVATEAVLKRIDICIDRLLSGLSVLQLNDDAWSAFLLMNEAMLLQRAKTKKITDSNLDSVEWYPFQLAYILQIVPDITEKNSDFRDYADLLWFPTGGGKTEAYLGVAAFTIFYRRLSNKPVKDGVTVIMRYTLRLLTIQQFERASALICACEFLRRQRSISGGRISIGLWIGSGMTPNHIDGEGGAAAVLKELKEDPDKKVYEGNPVQITTCPWCGETIDLDGYEIIKDKGMVIRCNRNPKCEFHSALPVFVIDDDIYSEQPTLLLSTIDKFARLAWEEDAISIFGNGICSPPELIIQDELHLISGPLGSLAGIYEIGVEYLCSQNGRYPKVIASTATVKNAAEQIKNLYNKQMFQFPPSGIDFSDSFFAIKATDEERPARTYLGLCETGGSLADLMIRVYANLIFIRALFIKQNRADEVVDQFSTIIGYFNAIRDLGSTDNIINDRIFTYIRTLIKIKFKDDSEDIGLILEDVRMGTHDELTSRKTSKEVKETLSNLELRYNEYGSYTYVLASNMLSVGIDINRLGIMTMYNQPKTNAEYIQATSRVGRQNPGIVLALYNGSRSRDKSHYEQFGFYHKSFYQYVEATSVTPFSARAIEKAIHCVLIIMLRLSEPTLSGNEAAVNFSSNAAYTDKVKNFILDRVKEIHPESVDVAREWISHIIERWDELAKENPDTLVYYKRNTAGFCNLLMPSEQGATIDFPTTLNSLRNVDSSSNVFIQER